MKTAFGIVSDDLTGGLLVASYFEEAGLECPVCFDPTAIHADDHPAPIAVIAARTRLIPAEAAIAETSRALDALDARGCRMVAYKACASFDSTETGNIGPIADLLADRYGDLPILMNAGFPEFGCTVHQGHLFYRGLPVNESVKRLDPVTPMPDANLVRFLSRQTRTPVGLLSHLDLARGEAAARQSLDSRVADGYRHILMDCSDMNDVAVGATLALDRRAVVASDPLIISLGLKLGGGHAAAPPPPRHAEGPVAMLCGSVGPVAETQLRAFAEHFPVLTVSLLDDVAENAQVEDALAWARAHAGTPLGFTTCADELGVKAAQSRLGTMDAARKAERILAGIARGLHRQGTRRFIVSGGETSGAVVSSLGLSRVRALPRGPLGGGFCVSDGSDPVSLFLKSGKLGTPDVLPQAIEHMKPGER